MIDTWRTRGRGPCLSPVQWFEGSLSGHESGRCGATHMPQFSLLETCTLLPWAVMNGRTCDDGRAEWRRRFSTSIMCAYVGGWVRATVVHRVSCMPLTFSRLHRAREGAAKRSQRNARAGLQHLYAIGCRRASQDGTMSRGRRPEEGGGRRLRQVQDGQAGAMSRVVGSAAVVKLPRVLSCLPWLAVARSSGRCWSPVAGAAPLQTLWLAPEAPPATPGPEW